MPYQAQNREILIDYFRQGAQANPAMLGVEVEHFVVYAGTLEDVPYESGDGRLGVREVLEYLAQFYPEKSFGADGDLIGLGSEKGTVTLEPASQLELSIAPYKSVREVEDAYREFRGYVDPYLAEHGALLVPAGYHPHDKANDLQLIPKQRYRFMDDYFQNHIHTHGERMMRASASTQVSVDFSSEADAVRKLRVAQALAPVLAALTDNTHVFEGEPTDKPLARLNIWRNVDNNRCGSVPGLFNEGWGFANYADWLLRNSPIFVTRAAAAEPEGPSLRPFYDTPAVEVYADASMTVADCEHLLSMVWPDVRLKHFVEIRPADSLSLPKILAYTALIKGIFYSEESLRSIENAFGVVNGVWPLNDTSTDAAIALIREQGSKAVIYGKTLSEWEAFVVKIAREALSADEQGYLDAFELGEDGEAAGAGEAAGVAAVGEAGKQNAAAIPYDSYELEQAYVEALNKLDGDLESRAASQNYLATTRALRNGEPVPWAVVPKIFSPADVNRLRMITNTMYSILEKTSAAYAADPAVRELYSFAPAIEAAVAAEPAIKTQIPIARYDIFLNEQTGDFKFCELNTDGSASSVITEEVSAALTKLKTTAAFAKTAGKTIEVFHPVDAFVATIAGALKRTLPQVENPTLGVVDYTESLGVDEVERYIELFAAQGITARISDIRSLSYADGVLSDDKGPLDGVWRRVVISEIEAKPNSGADALIAAATDGKVPIIGSFRSWPAATKTFFVGLFDERLRRYLTEDEKAFVDAHVPHTYLLTPECDLAAFAERERWILKPSDGYGSHDVIAGADVSAAEWQSLLEQHRADGFIVQEYAPQFATPNAPGNPADPAATAVLEPYSNMEGLFVIDGEFVGVFTRSGTKKVIDYSTSRLNLGCLIAK